MDGQFVSFIAVVLLFLTVFFLQCLSTDMVSTVVCAVPFFVLFFIITAMFGDFQEIFQAIIGVLVLVNIIMIFGNLMKNIIA